MNWTGLEIIGDKGKVVAGKIASNSIAAGAGVKAGDLILEVDRKDTSQFSLFEVRRRFAASGPVTLMLRRPKNRAEPTTDFEVELTNPKETVSDRPTQ